MAKEFLNNTDDSLLVVQYDLENNYREFIVSDGSSSVYLGMDPSTIQELINHLTVYKISLSSVKSEE